MLCDVCVWPCLRRNDGSGDAFCVRVDPELTISLLNSLKLDGITIPFGHEFDPEADDASASSHERAVVAAILRDMRWLELYKRVVETVNLSLYRRYDDDISCALNAIRGTAHHYWLTERGGKGSLSRVHPINHTYFTRCVRCKRDCEVNGCSCCNSVCARSDYSTCF